MTARPERAERVEGRVEGRSLWYWCALGAIAMSLGWGLRGSIGGGSLGAMIPGAMPSGLNAGPAISVSPALREMSELRSSK